MSLDLVLDLDPTPPSRGVIACNGQGTGCVIWWSLGSTLEHEINEISPELAELGLDDAPRGISIWEGIYTWHDGPCDCPQDGYTEPIGEFRPPTDEEWAAIRAGRNPFEAAARTRTETFARHEPPDVNEEIVIDDPTAPTPIEESR